MSQMFEGLLYLFFLTSLGIIFFSILIAAVIEKHAAKKFIKKKDKNYALKKNLLITLSFYLLSTIVFFLKFGIGWGTLFAFKILPVLSLLLLMFLELLELLKEAKKRIFRK